jgi:hypothetical protein
MAISSAARRTRAAICFMPLTMVLLTDRPFHHAAIT